MPTKVSKFQVRRSKSPGPYKYWRIIDPNGLTHVDCLVSKEVAQYQCKQINKEYLMAKLEEQGLIKKETI